MTREGGSSISHFKMNVQAWLKNDWSGLLAHRTVSKEERAQKITGTYFSLLNNIKTTIKLQYTPLTIH
jgi:hypothetical protein